MPAYNEEFKNLQGTSLLIWESLKSALDKKMLYYNFGGTWKDQHELYMFKKGWNSRDIYYQYILFRDLPKIKEIGIEELRKSFEHFYIVPFKELSTSDS